MTRVAIALSVIVLAMAGIFWLAYGYEPAAPPQASKWRSHAGAKFLDVPGFRASYVDRGRGPTIMLLHGGGTWSYSWRNQIDAFVGAGFRVVAVDMPGHGFTQPTPGHRPAFDLKSTDAFLASFMDRLGIKSASIIGNSWGGGWALHYAQTHPKRVDKLILIGAAGLPHKTLAIWEWMKTPLLGEVLIKLGRRSDIRQGLLEAVANPDAISDADVTEAETAILQPGNAVAQVRYMRNLDWSVTEKALHETRAPVLIIWGEQDRYVNLAIGRRLNAALPQSTLIVVPDAGHIVHEEKPAFVNAAIMSFLMTD